MTRLVVLTMFRSASIHHMRRFFGQLERLAAEALGRDIHVRCVAVEGDSVNAGCRDRLREYAACRRVPLDVVIREHGGPWCGSVETAERMRQVSFAANGAFEAVQEADDVAVWVESDLIWGPQNILNLVAQLKPGLDILAAPPFAGEAFYDIWGFRAIGGARFGPFFPFAPGLKHPPTEIESAGSCLVMRACVARECRLPAEDALVGFCREARGKGYRVFTDWRERIAHP